MGYLEPRPARGLATPRGRIRADQVALDAREGPRDAGAGRRRRAGRLPAGTTDSWRSRWSWDATGARDPGKIDVYFTNRMIPAAAPDHRRAGARWRIVGRSPRLRRSSQDLQPARRDLRSNIRPVPGIRGEGPPPSAMKIEVTTDPRVSTSSCDRTGSDRRRSPSNDSSRSCRVSFPSRRPNASCWAGAATRPSPDCWRRPGAGGRSRSPP